VTWPGKTLPITIEWTIDASSWLELEVRMVMASPVKTTEPSAVVDQFTALAKEWKSATALLSSTTAMVDHPAYQGIIALGPAVIPLLLHELERGPVHWFEALQATSGENPVPPDHWGNIAAMRNDWLTWGRQRRLI
jgi:hypothetical protein